MTKKFFHFRTLSLVGIFLLGTAILAYGQCPTLPAVVTKVHTDITCSGANDGTITVELGDGSPNINFELFDLFLGSFVTLSVTEINDPDGNGNFRKVRYTNVYPSSFQVVAFKLGCPPLQISETPTGFNVLEPNPLQITVNAIDPDCNPLNGGGNADGSIDLTITGGRTPYNVTWPLAVTAIGGSVVNSDPGNVLAANLDGGAYSVAVEDASGCDATQAIDIPISTVVNAGPDDVICATSTTLAGAAPGPGEKGKWTVVSGTGVFTDDTQFNTTVTGLTPGATSEFRWTITDLADICPGNSDEVIITVDAPPTPAAAGPDQPLCGVTSTTLAANTPVVGIGAWTITNGTGGTIADPSNPASGFTGTAGATYELTWTITNGTCPPSADVVNITFENAPTVANAGPDDAACGTSITLAANAPVVGVGTWTIVSGVGGTIANPNNPASTFTGTAGTTYQLRWTITNGTCTPSQDDVSITFDIAPTPSVAGADQPLCGVTSTTLAANTPVIGVGTWTVTSGAGGIIADPSNPASGFSGTAGTSYQLTWTITNGSCPPSADAVNIIFDVTPTIANAGPDDALCTTSTALAANTPAVGVGTWSIISGAGGTVADPNNPTSNFTGTAGTTYQLRWTITNGSCTPSQDDVSITFDAAPTPAAAGADQPLCAVTSTTLAANTPVVGVGTWTITNGTGGTIADPSNPASGFSGTAGTSYELTWTITNGSCPPSADVVNIIFDIAPTVANAGPDDALCATSTTLAANTPVVGVGTWTIVSGVGGTIADPSNPASNFTGAAGTTYLLRWTINNGTCTPSQDDVSITFDAAPTPAAAGADQPLCAVTSTTLAANTPVVGVGVWTITNGIGGTIADPSNPASGFTGTAGATYELTWTITNGTCPPSADVVNITFDLGPTVANAGADDALCATSTTLAANTPVVGVGTWTIVSGAGGTIADPSNPTSNFTGAAGTTYQLRWTITNGTCTPSQDDVSITFDAAPTTAAAGADQPLCGVTSATLAANTPVVGVGAWTITNGTGGTIADPANPASGFTGTAGATYELTWTITNGTCPPSADVVNITFDLGPTVANAGADDAVCATSTTLAANTPVVGVGTWTIVSGAGGTIADPSNPTSNFTGTAGTTYQLRWTITNGTCTPSQDDVSITFDVVPTTAAAGADQPLCGVTSTTLAANTPVVGVGAWTITNGTGGTIADPSNPASGFTGAAGATYELTWTITNGTCSPSTDVVNITFDLGPTAANAGPDDALCAISTTLAANTPVLGTGTWTIVSGAGGTIADPSNPTSNFTGTAGTTYQLRWTITNGTCTPSQDDVSITFDAAPTPANAGADLAPCAVTSVNLAANTPIVGTGSWTIVSGTGGSIGDVTNPASSFDGLAGSTYVLNWTVVNGACSSVDDVQVAFLENPTVASAGADKTVCGPTILEGNTPSIGTGVWTVISGLGGMIADPADPASPFTGTAGTAYQLRWTISNGSCTPTTDDVVITFDAGSPTPSNAGPDQSLCATATTLAANSPIVGTGSWSIVSGTGGNVTVPADPNSGFSGVAGATYVLRWTISSAVVGCGASTDDVTIVLETAPTTAIAGPDDATCAASINLAANVPVSGTGAWSVVAGAGGVFGDASSATSTFTGSPGVVYTLRWTVTSSCGNSTDDVVITFEEQPSPAVAGTDVTVCGTATLSANAPAIGTGLWTIISGTGGSLADPTDPNTNFDGVAGTAYTLRWTITNGSCTPTTDDVVVTFDINTPTIANAGPDASICGTLATLGANAPVVGTGAWSIVSGAGGTFTDAANPATDFTGFAGVTYVLRWTITSSCGTSSDDMEVTFDAAPTVADAGPDKTSCGPTDLEGNVPTNGTGTWTIIAGTGGILADPADPTSLFSGVGGVAYTLRWTISSGVCAATQDDVEITFDINSPTPAVAGPDQSVCATSVTLAANTPLVGTGAWTITSGAGGVIADPADPASSFSGTAGTTYVLRWTITPAGLCTASSDDVSITFDIVPTVADAGADQQLCGNSTTLGANAATSGAGLWSLVSGTGTFADAADPATTFTATAAGLYELAWTISNTCGTTTDNVLITFDGAPTVANAGADKTVCGPTNLEGNAPAVGTGAWTIISGAGGSLADPASATSLFSGVAGTSYTLRWTIQNGTCTPSFDDVDITFDLNSPTVAVAGADQAICGVTTTLTGNTPVVGTGSWSIVSGVGGAFVDANNPTTDFSGTAGSVYVLQWTISSGTLGCASSNDDVTISFNTIPSAADAGDDVAACGTSVTLGANTPVSGSGTWTINSGVGGSFVDNTLPNATFNGVPGTSYVLDWTISNACGTTTDQVSVTLDEAPTVAAAGPDQIICTAVTTTLNANSPVIGTGIWTIVSGTGGAVLNPTNPGSQFIGSAGTSYVLRWIIANGSCSPSVDDVTINFAAPPATAPTVTICVNDPAVPLTATATGATSFNWYYYTDPSDITTRTLLANTVSGSFTPGAELNTTVVTSYLYEVTAVYPCGESAGSQITIDISNTGGCGGGTGNCATVVITPQPSPATCTLSNGSILFNIVPFTPAVNNTGVIIEIEGVSVTNETIARTNFNDPQFNALPIGVYTYKITYGDLSCIKTGFVTIDQSGTVGTPVASNVISPVCAGSATGSVTIDVPGETGNLLEWSLDGINWTSFTAGNQITGIPAGAAPTFERVISIRRNASDPCNAAAIISIQDANPAITSGLPTSTPVSGCTATDGTITIPGITGGVGAKQIRIYQVTSGGPQILRDFVAVTADPHVVSDLGSGTYFYELRDETGCTVSTEASPVTITAPGAVAFNVIIKAGADCGPNAGKNGVIGITFDPLTSSGNYQIGVSTSPFEEPFEYANYFYNIGSTDEIVVDTLSRGDFFVFVKPSGTNVCPSILPTGTLDGPYMIDFDVQRVCGAGDGSAAVQLVNLQGDPLVNLYNVEVYMLSDLATRVDEFSAEKVNDIVEIIYDPNGTGTHAWLNAPEDYLIRVYQLNQLYCIGERPFNTPSHDEVYAVRETMAITIDKIRASLPEPRRSGGFLLKNITGGVPFPDSEGPYYSVSVFDPSNNTELFGPIEVRRNSQGRYEYDFRNLPVGNYELIVTDSYGCSISTIVIVPADTRILIPNIFTPNGDAVNDQFEVLNLPASGGHKLVITNRWGKQMFTSEDYQEGRFWDAEDVPEGIYYYRLDVSGDKVYTGWVEVTRGSKP